MSVDRNDPCPCGSGKKYKACCEGKRPRSAWVATVSVIAFVVLAAWALADALNDSGKADDTGAGPQRVWSEEHGHYHDAPGVSGAPQPGPAPPGKVWNAEHGHWHDAPVPGQQTEALNEPPPGDPPPGKVWNAEHGHWHDAEPAAGTLPPSEEDVSYVDE